MNAFTKLEYKIVSLTTLVQSLRVAYVRACNSLRTANKLKDKRLGKYGRSRAMSLIHKLRIELKKYDNGNLSIMESIAYRGVLVNKF